MDYLVGKRLTSDFGFLGGLFIVHVILWEGLREALGMLWPGDSGRSPGTAPACYQKESTDRPGTS